MRRTLRSPVRSESARGGRGVGFLASAASVTLIALCLSAAAPPASATESTTTTTLAAVDIGGGLAFGGAVITGVRPHTATRRLNAYQSAVFVQSWLGDSFYGKPKHEPVPTGVPIYRLDVTGSWGGGGVDFTTRAVFYASDGTRAWIAFPSPQITPATGAPAKLDFWDAPTRVIPAFAGTGKLIPAASIGATPSTGAAPSATTSSDKSSAWPWAVGAAAVVVLGAVAAVALRRRRVRPA